MPEGECLFQHLKRLFRHSVVYGLAETVSRGTGSILILIYTRFISPEDLGVRTLFYTAAAFLGLFYTLGLDNAFLRYFMDRDYEDRRDQVLSTAFFFTAGVGFLFLAAAFLLDEPLALIIAKSGEYAYLVRLLFLIMVFDTVVIYPTLVLRAEGKTRYYSIIAFARFVLFIGFNLLFVGFLGRGLNGIFEANLAVVVVVAFLLAPVYNTYLGGHLSGAVLRRMLTFGVPTIFTLLAMRIVDNSDRFLIAWLLGDRGREALGFYTVAYTLGMAGIMVFVNSFRLAWQPFFLSVKEDPGARDMFSRIATYYAMFIGMVFLGVTLFRSEIFSLWAPPPAYPQSYADLLPLVAVAYILDGFYLIMLAGVFIREKTKLLPLATVIGAVLNFGLNLLFIPRFGVYGAAATTIVAYTAMVVTLYFISRRVYRVNYEFGRLLTVGVLTAVIAVIPEFVSLGAGLSGIVFRGALLLIPPVVYLAGGFLHLDEQTALAGIRRRFTGR